MAKKKEVSQYLEVEVPNHEKDLENAKEYIEKIQKQFILLKNTLKYDSNTHKRLNNNLYPILLFLAEKSIPIFEITDNLEEKYVKKYKSSPALAKKLWIEHVALLHKPYDKLKNECYTLVNEMEIEMNRVKLRTPNKISSGAYI